MFAIQKSIVTSSAVDGTLLCHFVHADRPNLVVASGSMLSVYRLVQTSGGQQQRRPDEVS